MAHLIAPVWLSRLPFLVIEAFYSALDKRCVSGSFCAAGAFGGGASAPAFGQSQPAASGAFSFGSTPAFGQVQVPEPLQAACSARCIPGVALQLAAVLRLVRAC